MRMIIFMRKPWIPAPEKTVNLLVCVADADGAIGHC